MKKHLTKLKNKKFITLAAALTVSVALILVIVLGIIGNKSNPVIAKVDGKKIYKIEVENKLKGMFPGDSVPDLEKLPKEIIEILVKDIYVEEELDKKAKKSGVSKNEDVRKKIDDYARKVIRQAYLESLTKGKVTDQSVRDRYIELVNEIAGKKEFHLRYIVVKDKSEADMVRGLAFSTSFANLAKKYSIDESTSSKGGDLGYVLESNLGKEFYDAISGLRKGQVSKPVQTKFGWNIFKVEDVRDAKAESFDTIKSALEDQMKKEIMKNSISDIAEPVKVEVLIKTKDLSKKATSDEKESQKSEAKK